LKYRTLKNTKACHACSFKIAQGASESHGPRLAGKRSNSAGCFLVSNTERGHNTGFLLITMVAVMVGKVVVIQIEEI